MLVQKDSSKHPSGSGQVSGVLVGRETEVLRWIAQGGSRSRSPLPSQYPESGPTISVEEGQTKSGLDWGRKWEMQASRHLIYTLRRGSACL